MTVDLVLVDDHRIVRESLKAILARERSYRIVGEAETGSEGVALCRTLKPRIVVMDISLPGMNGLEAAAEIQRHCPTTQVLILSMHYDPESVRAAIRCGVRGYVLKSASSREVVEALRTVSSGSAYFSPQIATYLLELVQQPELEKHKQGAVESLTAREIQVLRLIAAGKASKEIAALLNLRVDTVRTYRKKMMHKLRINNVASLTRFAITAGLTYPNLSAEGSEGAGGSRPDAAEGTK